MPKFRSILLSVFLAIAVSPLAADEAAIRIDSPMPPPEWALLEREVLKAGSMACERFAGRYLDDRGYLEHYIRWGTLDGPDDAIETFHNWTLLHALGGSDSVLQLYKKALEGHYRQYKDLRTTYTELAKDGAYYKEFITQSDFFHTGEGMRGFMMMGLSDPTDERLRRRMKRFAGLYMNEDPEAPNYDPERKLIRSIWTGSKGPMMRRATTYDWVGDPGKGRFHLLHGGQGSDAMADIEDDYPEMLEHCAEYLDSVGDHPLNLATTGFGLNAYMLSHEKKYRDWVLEYVDAWRERIAASGGNIPTNVGLDGTPGGEYGGKWYKGTYGWNFTIWSPEYRSIAHRNTFDSGSWPGFGNAFLLTGDPAYVAVLRRQMDNLYAQKRTINGQEMIPNGHGEQGWYNWTANLYTHRLLEIYLWSMDRKDLERVPRDGWVEFLEGGNPAYPAEALRADLARIRDTINKVDNDPTTPDTRLADWPMLLNPAETQTLTNLTLGGYLAGNIWTLHSRLRYFDPARRRSGLPEDVGALVEKLTADGVTVTLVNVNQIEPRTVIVQAGGYGEHRFDAVMVGGRTTAAGDALATVRLEPGAGAKLEFKMTRYANQPTLAQPWNRQAAAN